MTSTHSFDAGNALAKRSAAAPEVPTIVLVGNPNVGKTTLFNRLTGHNARVGNYPGITVERRVGQMRWASEQAGLRANLVDVPGAYSLSARSAEEQIALDAALGLSENPEPALVVVVVEAGQLIRNLYVVLQLLELEVPTIVAVNMMDEARESPPNPEALSAVLGVPCVGCSASTGEGIEALREAIGRALIDPPKSSVEIRYPSAVRAAVDRVAETLPAEWRRNVERDRALARWALLSVDPDDELVGVPDELRETCAAVRAEAEGRDFDLDIIGARYAFLEEVAPAFTAPAPGVSHVRAASDRVDRILIHPVFGFGIFLVLMLLIFQSLFTWADPAISVIEGGVGILQDLVVRLLPEGAIRDMITEGIIGGVGNVVVFLPQILLLFFFIGLLEDSGYMARVAYLMDRVMRALGLHGRAFVPMLSGFACAIPAILATRTMERQRDRLLTMLVVPLMTCSARLPVYTLVIAALFPPTRVFGWLPVQGLLMVAMYVFATTVALIAAYVLGRTVVRGRGMPLILELPPYRVPKLAPTLRMMWARARTFLSEAGTVILVCTVGMWVLLSYPKVDAPDALTDDPPAVARYEIENSYGGKLGKTIEPVLAPLGFDWRIGIGIIGAFSAREVFVSTLGIVYGVGDDDAHTEPLREHMRAEIREDGRPVYSPLVGLSLMVFFALACQCMSTLAVVHRETKSWRWPAFLFAYMTTLAWVVSFLVYQGGRLLGFS